MTIKTVATPPPPPRNHPAARMAAVFTATFLLICLSLLVSVNAWAAPVPPDKALQSYLAEIEKKFTGYGWNDVSPAKIPWQYHRTTRRGKPLIFVQFGNAAGNCTLLLGAVHGDEPPSAYVLFRLANYIQANPALFKDMCIIIAPLVNPDGFLSKPQTRVNGNGVDINRNFPTRDWTSQAQRQWVSKYKRNKRYNPGRKAASEQETAFQVALIKRFKPQKILSVHSPLGFYDYDGPSSDLDSFGQWLDTISKETRHPLKKFGYFPGSLGNYAGHERNIFTLTLELRSSDPGKGKEFFGRFQPMMMKFLTLPIDTHSSVLKIDHTRLKAATKS